MTCAEFCGRLAWTARGFILLFMLVAMCASEPSPSNHFKKRTAALKYNSPEAYVLLRARDHDDRSVGVMRVLDFQQTAEDIPSLLAHSSAANHLMTHKL